MLKKYGQKILVFFTIITSNQTEYLPKITEIRPSRCHCWHQVTSILNCCGSNCCRCCAIESNKGKERKRNKKTNQQGTNLCVRCVVGSSAGWLVGWLIDDTLTTTTQFHNLPSCCSCYHRPTDRPFQHERVSAFCFSVGARGRAGSNRSVGRTSSVFKEGERQFEDRQQRGEIII